MLKIISNVDAALIKQTAFITNWSSGFNKLTLSLYFTWIIIRIIILEP